MRIILAIILSLITLPALARVPMDDARVMAMSFINASEFYNNYSWAGNTISEADAIEIITFQIEDAYAMGTRIFLLDAATTNSQRQIQRMKWWNSAARNFNATRVSDPICITPMFEDGSAGDGTTTGALLMFDAADAGDTAKPSPLCTDAGRPVIATWGNNTLVNPLAALTPRGSNFVIIGTNYNNTVNHWTAANVTTLKNAGAKKLIGYLWASGNSGFSSESNVLQKKSDMLAAGVDEVVLGIGTARAAGCGIGGSGAKTPNWQLTDFRYFQHFLEGLRIARDANMRIMWTMGAPGDLGEGSYITSSLICGPRDKVNHNVTVGEVNHGFTCPNVPDYLRAALPSGFFRSYSLPLWFHGGFHELGKILGKWAQSGVEPNATPGIVSFAYRQHKWALAGSWQICPSGQYVINPSSIGGAFQGDYIALTSWFDAPTRVQVILAGDTLFDGTLPARQAKLSGADKQTLVAFGNRVGRPTIRILNSTGAVIGEKLGLLEITTTPKHFGGQTGPNPHLYADSFSPGTDLVITDISWVPATALSGQPVSFSATIKNAGGITFPAGPLSVSFRVNNANTVWFDGQVPAIAAGEFVTVTANGGWTGSKDWTPANIGSFAIVATVDYTDQVSESDEGNNSRQETAVVITQQADVPSITLEVLDPVVARGTTGTKQRIRLRRSGDTSKDSTLEYVAVPTDSSNPAQPTDFVGGFPGGTVTFFGDDLPEPPTEECNAGAVPTPAKDAGLTYLAFCDDFSDLHKSFELTDGNRKLWSPGKKWSRNIPFGGDPEPSVSSYSSDGDVLRFAPDKNYAQFSFTTTDYVGGKIVGFSTKGEDEWFAEIKWRFDGNWRNRDKGFPAWWSHDTCILYRIVNGQKTIVCDKKLADEYGQMAIELDFWELISGRDKHANHLQDAIDGGWHNYPTPHDDPYRKCPNDAGAPEIDYANWHTRYIHVNPKGTDGIVHDYLNGKIVHTRDKTDKNKCKTPNGTKGVFTHPPDFLDSLDNGDYTQTIGAGPGAILYIDYVRVWMKPR